MVLPGGKMRTYQSPKVLLRNLYRSVTFFRQSLIIDYLRMPGFSRPFPESV